MKKYLRLGIVCLITISCAAASPTFSKALTTVAYPACDAARLQGADLPAFKHVIVNSTRSINPTGAAYRFFIVNQVIVAPAELRRGHRDFIVYVRGPGVCGTSGCAAYIFEKLNTPATAQPEYRLLTKILPARLPIRVLPTMHNRARDIGVAVEGGGIRIGYTGALVFDGISYANNPTLARVHHVKATDGRIVLGAPSASIQQCQLR